MIVLQGHRARVECVGFSPDGAAVLAPTWRGLQEWRPFADGGKPRVIPGSLPNRFRFTPDGKRLLTSGTSVRLLGVGADAGKPVWEGHEMYFDLSHRGEMFVAGLNAGDGHRMALRRTADGSAVWQRPIEAWWAHPQFLPCDEEFVRVGFESTSRGLVYHIATHATATGDELRRSAQLAAEVRDWEISPDGRLAACRTTVWVHIYPLQQSFTKPLATLRNDNRKEFTGIAFHPSGRYLAATSNDQTVKLYDTDTWQVARTFTWDIGRMRSVAFSPDGSLAAAGSDTGKVVVWDVDV